MMDKFELFNLFLPEFRDLVLNYTKALSKVFQEYQVVIFLARKAICFYKSLVITGIIDNPKNCEVYSSRILTYNVSERFKGKKVIVIDDVMIKGYSINKALHALSKWDIEADVYIMAKPNDLKDNDLKWVHLVRSYSEITKEDTHHLSKNIATFIEASMCPYNIDQPIYSLQDFDSQKINEFVSKHNLIDITSKLQQRYGIKSYSLEIPGKYLTNSLLEESISLCKIRFLSGKFNEKTIFLAIPFVLLNEMSISIIEEVFSQYENEQINQFIHNENSKIIHESQLKILHYVLAAQLMDAFSQTFNIIGLHRLNSNDNYVFSQNILEMINQTRNPFSFAGANIANNICYNYDFKQNEYLNHVYDYIYSERMDYINYYNSDNTVILDELLILSDLKDYLENVVNGEVDNLIFSNIIDILIDSGVIIPSVIHGDNESIIRAYKCGEVYALNKEHFSLFAFTLFQYLKNIEHDRIHRTEFEKLCVLFFREIVNNGILRYSEESGNEDEYSICYSKFGPRVSTSRPIYSANDTSALASKLNNIGLMDDLEKIEIKVQEKDSEEKKDTAPSVRFDYAKYYSVSEVLEDDIETHSWIDSGKDFARKYKLLYRALFNEDNDEILFDEVRDMHMRTYIEFLIMLSIGLSRREQLLSLLAEIYLFDTSIINGSIYHILTNCGRVLDGLISGMWKYMCYAQDIHPLKKVYDRLSSNEETEHLSVFIGDIFRSNRDIDKNINIEPLIHEVGKLIFSIVYSIWFMYGKYHIRYREHGEYVDIQRSRKREFFYKELKQIRESIEDQIRSSTVEQDIQTLKSLQLECKEIFIKYNTNISDGKKPTSSAFNDKANEFSSIKITGPVKYVANFEHGGMQTNIN